MTRPPSKEQGRRTLKPLVKSTEAETGLDAPGFRPARLTTWLRWLPLTATPVLLWLLTQDRVKVEPKVWVSAGFVGLFTVWTAWRPRRMQGLDLALAALAGLAATHVLFYPGFPQGHDIMTHLWGTYAFFMTVRSGAVVPIWVHHIGLGMPFPMFYPPLAFFFMLPFEALGLAVFDSFKYGFVLYNMLAGAAMYFVVHRWTSSRTAALVAAAAYCFAPYHLLESHYRVAVAEAAGMAVLPLFFYTMHRAITSPNRRSWRNAAIWTAVLTVTHPLSLSMAGIGMGLWTLALHRFRPGRALARRLGLLLLVALTGLAAAGYYTVPVAAEGRYASISSTLGGRKPLYGRYGLEPRELVERRAWSKWQRAEPHGSKHEDNEMPFYFGISLLTLLPLAPRRRQEKAAGKDRGGDGPTGTAAEPGSDAPLLNRLRIPAESYDSSIVLGLLTMTLGTLALTLYPLDVLFARFPPMTILQFPWRYLTIATFGACALAGFAAQNMEQAARGRTWSRLIPGALVALMVVDFFPYQGAASWRKPYDGVSRIAEHRKGLDRLPFRVDYLSFPPSHTDIDLSLLRRVYPEYFTPVTRRIFKNAKKDSVLERAAVGLTLKKGKRWLHPRPYAEFFPADGGESRGLEFTRAGGTIAVSLPGEAGRIEIKEQWFPGWMVTLGKRRFEVASTKDGLMSIPVEATDTGSVRLHFSRTRWDRLLGLFMSLGTLTALHVPLRRGARQEQQRSLQGGADT